MIEEFRIAHVRSDGWVATTWNNMSDPSAFAAPWLGPRSRKAGSL